MGSEKHIFELFLPIIELCYPFLVKLRQDYENDLYYNLLELRHSIYEIIFDFHIDCVSVFLPGKN